MKYLLDTCVISEMIKIKPNQNVMSWIKEKDETHLYISVICLGEIKKGIAKLSDKKKKNALIDWFSDLEDRFEGRIIPIDKNVAEKWGTIQGELEKKGMAMPAIDSLIACSALAYNMIVVTRNGNDMERSGVEIINPWL
jgi:predicted nucleic acid-binding protein